MPAFAGQTDYQALEKLFGTRLLRRPASAGLPRNDPIRDFFTGVLDHSSLITLSPGMSGN
jgi:hypothetical protein